jgi:5-methylcytosine-specific restriction protein B
VTVDELARKLVEMYENADGDKAAMVHLFGIRYADEIREAGCSATDIIKLAKLQDGSYMLDSYKTEISKGINLAKYVVDKKSLVDFINKKGN